MNTRTRLWLTVLTGMIWLVVSAGWAAEGGPLSVLKKHVVELGQGKVLPKPAARKGPVAGDSITVATYNIAHARGNKRGGLNELGNSRNLWGIAKLLKDRKVDIVGFTEISGVDLRSGLVDQPSLLALLLGFSHVYGENVRQAAIAVSQGNAIHSRFPILSHTNHKLFRLSAKEEQRGCLEALIDLGAGRRIRVFVAHLSLKAEESGKQVAQLYELASKNPEPSILMGDFNSYPASANMAYLRERMVDITGNVDTTYMNQPGDKIDYIYLRGALTGTGAAWVAGFKEGYSDHGCLGATVGLK
jgi:endonuclease/exonuclease/phosphatase family metal-dependent hydrolase